MGKQNNVMLDYLRDNRRFADLFNGGLFAGEQVVSSSDLMEASELHGSDDVLALHEL